MQSARHTVTLTILLTLLTAASVAQTWDATKDFGPSNPNGVWSYGDGITGTSFTLYSFYYIDCGDLWGVKGIVCWTTQTHDVPFVSFNTTGDWLSFWGIVIPPDVLFLHPGPDDGQDTIVQWTAPVAGTYYIHGFFEILDSHPTGIVGLVFRNGTPLFRGELLGPPAQPPDKVGGREDFYFAKLSLKAGDVISFGVNKDDDYHYDSTGFNATITTAAPCAVCSP